MDDESGEPSYKGDVTGARIGKSVSDGLERG